MPSNSVESFWDFSVRTYRTSGVPEACLYLQDTSGVDVNMFLYCCWLAVRRGEFDADLWCATIEFSTEWSSRIVTPLRLSRTWMKVEGCANGAVPTKACMRLRDEIKSVEFDAEKMQQEILESLTPVPEHNVSDANELLAKVVKNVRRYSRHLGLEIGGEVAETISTVVAAACPHLDRRQVLRAFDAQEKREIF